MIALCRHPVVARIDGLCIGGGLKLASTADLRICSDRARFGISIKRLGFVVVYAELVLLVHLIGSSNAKESLMESQIFMASRAYDMGLVNRVVAATDLDNEVQATAKRIADGALLVARWHKKFTARLLSSKPLSQKRTG